MKIDPIAQASAATASPLGTHIGTIVLCGGAGSRLWSASREAFPKQFISLLGEESMFQQTLGRIRDPLFSARSS